MLPLKFNRNIVGRVLEQQHLPAIVILGAAVWKNGVPSPSLKRRIDCAAEIFKRGESDLIIASGGLGKFPPSEAQVMRRDLVSLGVSTQAILLEEDSATTFENAAYSVHILRKHKRDSVIVVTDRYHIARAVMTFRVMGMAAKGAFPKTTKSSALRKQVWFRVREAFALPVYLFKLIVWRLFNGELPRP